MEPIIIESRISKNLAENQQYFDEKLRVGMNYDMLTSKLQIAGKSAVLYYINGMYKDELMQKVLPVKPEPLQMLSLAETAEGLLLWML